MRTSMSQMVHVVSMEEVPSRFGSVSFQSNDVSGAQNSLFLFCSAARTRAVESWSRQGPQRRRRQRLVASG